MLSILQNTDTEHSVLKKSVTRKKAKDFFGYKRSFEAGILDLSPVYVINTLFFPLENCDIRASGLTIQLTCSRFTHCRAFIC